MGNLGFEFVRDAEMLANHHHRNQPYGIFPYMKHIYDVVGVFDKAWIDTYMESNANLPKLQRGEPGLMTFNELIISCYLHDCVEDGYLSYNDIKTHFNKDVAEAVFCVTDGDGRNRKERKRPDRTRSNQNARIVKLCDRTANVRNSKRLMKDKFVMYEGEHVDFKQSISVAEELQTQLEKNLWKQLDLILTT